MWRLVECRAEAKKIIRNVLAIALSLARWLSLDFHADVSRRAHTIFDGMNDNTKMLVGEREIRGINLVETISLNYIQHSTALYQH